MKSPRELKAHYRRGENISALMREDRNLATNDNEIIEVSYDLQAGSYIQALDDPDFAARKHDYNQAITDILASLEPPDQILEAGVGEATTLSSVLDGLGSQPRAYGFDLSWSRVAHACRWLHARSLDRAVLCTGDLFAIPLASDSIDLVYTSHSIEPNGGREGPILEELFRVARRYLVLFEPGYEFANAEARARMDYHGYCKGLRSQAEALGMKVIDHRPLPVTVNPLNPTAVTLIEKPAAAPGYSGESPLACPRYKTGLTAVGGHLYSPEALRVYPRIGGIPCLRIENGIFASDYEKAILEWGY